MVSASRVMGYNYVAVIVDGREYRADTLFNLRNVLLGNRNEFNDAAMSVEQAMTVKKDPMLDHLTTRIQKLP